MMLSLPRMFNLLHGLPHLPPRLAQPTAAPGRRPTASPLPAESPGFLHAGFAPFEPDLTGEIRQALGEEAARRAGDVP
ncbi:MAG: hypothetical protein ABSC95_29225 [Acetobacteraceae bacterium]